MPHSARIRLHFGAWAIAVLFSGMGIDLAIADPLDGEAKAEIAIIASTHGLAVRDGDELRIKAANGRTQTFRSEYKCGGTRQEPLVDWPHCHASRLTVYLPERQAFIVHTTLYEGHNFTWMSAISGATVELKAMPHYSPNGRLIAAVQANAADDFNGFQIWEVRDDTIELAWEFSPEDKYCDFASWEGNSSVLLVCQMYRNNGFTEKTPARLVYNAPGNPGWYPQFTIAPPKQP